MAGLFSLHVALVVPIAKEVAQNVPQCYSMPTKFFNDVISVILYSVAVFYIQQNTVDEYFKVDIEKLKFIQKTQEMRRVADYSTIRTGWQMLKTHKMSTTW